MYQQLQKIGSEKFCRIKVFRENLGQFRQNILFIPEKSPVATPIICMAIRQKIPDEN